jgi:hypothetical protein
MSTKQEIEKKLFLSENKYSPTFISKLSDLEKKKLYIKTDEDINLLILILYIMIISFIVIMLIVISQGDKYNQYPDDRKFRNDKKEKKDISFWNKIYYLLFGSLPFKNHKSNTSHLNCEKANCNNQNENIIKNNYNDFDNDFDKKYLYLNSFMNNYNSNSDLDSNQNYTNQFNESRKCLSGSGLSNNMNDNYSYLGLDFEQLD